MEVEASMGEDGCFNGIIHQLPCRYHLLPWFVFTSIEVGFTSMGTKYFTSMEVGGSFHGSKLRSQLLWGTVRVRKPFVSERGNMYCDKKSKPHLNIKKASTVSLTTKKHDY